MANLKLQGSTWHVRLVIPKDLRIRFNNKSELWQSTGTGDKKLADIIGGEIVAGWKRQFYALRNGINVHEWAKSWAKTLREANTTEDSDSLPSDRENVELILADELEDLVNTRQLTEDAAKAAFEVATGKRVILRDYKDDYLKQYRTHNIKTQAAYGAAVERFVSRFSDNKQVTSKSIKQWVTVLAEDENLSAKTIARMIQQAKNFWGYLAEHEIVTAKTNPFAGFKLTVPKTATRSIPILPFKPEEVVAFLATPTVQNDAQLSLLITLAMYTGARIEELAMLRRKDVDVKAGLIYIWGTKTDAAEREVPIHPALAVVLTDLFTTNESEEFVIAGLTIDKRGERGKALGKRFGRLKTAMGYTERKHCFHSIRKTVGTMFEQAEVLEGVAADILGHEKQTMTYGLYSGGSSLKQKRDAINKIKYPAPQLDQLPMAA